MHPPVNPQTPSIWLSLSEAADFLGVHFTTLRRWTDAGKAPCIRTPGGQRRFDQAELAAFLDSLRQGDSRAIAIVAEDEFTAGPHKLTDVGVTEEPWYGRLDDSQRAAMRNEGQQLMAVLLQYATRSNGGEVFLDEGRRLASQYGLACRGSGLSLVETTQAFIRVRRTIMDSVYEVGSLAGAPDADAWRLYDRMNNFLDAMLLATLESFTNG